MSSLDEKLRSAIATKRLVQFRYDGAQRVAEPHDYGVRKGVVKLLVYQLRRVPARSSNDPRGWRLLTVSKIDQCAILDETFPGTRSDAHQRHYEWDVIFARVE